MDSSHLYTFDQILELDSNNFYAPSSSLYNPTELSSPTYADPQQFIAHSTPQQLCLDTGPAILEDDLWQHYRLMQQQHNCQEFHPLQPTAPSKQLFYGEEEQFFSPMSADFLANFPSEYTEDDLSSCGSSPYMDQKYLSPITPSGSPPLPYYSNIPIDSLFLQCGSDANSFPTMLSPDLMSDNYLGLLALQQQQPQISPFSSPDDVPSLYASPLQYCEEDVQRESAETDESEEEEENQSVLPDSGNTELRGMGLYDDIPPLYTSPRGCSLGSLFEASRGRGLVLERSFGLPEQMDLMDDNVEGGDEEEQADDDQQQLYEETRWSQEFQPEFF